MTRRLSDQQRSLTASERRYRELFSSSPTPLLELDREHRIRGANEAAAVFLGVDPESALGTPLEDYVVANPDRSSGMQAAASIGDHDGMVEARWRLPDGDLAEVELRLRPSADEEAGG